MSTPLYIYLYLGAKYSNIRLHVLFLFYLKEILFYLLVTTFTYEDLEPAGHVIWRFRDSDVGLLHLLNGHGPLRSSVTVVHWDKLIYGIKVLHELHGILMFSKVEDLVCAYKSRCIKGCLLRRSLFVVEPKFWIVAYFDLWLILLHPWFFPEA